MTSLFFKQKKEGYMTNLNSIQVDENMSRAQKQDAAIRERFYFRKQILEPSNHYFLVFYHSPEETTGNDWHTDVTVDYIINGSVR